MSIVAVVCLYFVNYATGFVGIAVPSLSSAQVERQDEPSSSPDNPLTQEEALAKDARWYADYYGVPLEEAIRRLELQKPIGKLGAKLEANEAGIFAGLFVENGPEYQVVARFTRGGEQTLERYVEGGPLEGLVDSTPASATLAELRLAQFNATRLVRGLGIRSDSAVDVVGNRVEVRVTGKQGLLGALEASSVRLPEEVVVVEVPELTQPAASSLAGLRMFRFDFPTTTWCTSGFTVRRDADTEGVLTAAHCTGERIRDNSQATFRMHYKSNGNLIFLPREGRRLYGSWDLEWHTTPGYDDLPVYFDGYDYRSVNGLMRRTETFRGATVCDYGRITGFSCSTVNNTNVSLDRYVPDSNATFIEARNRRSYGILQDNGDSGGPVFRGGQAAGILSGGRSDATYHYIVYTASGYPEDMLVSIQLY